MMKTLTAPDKTGELLRAGQVLTVTGSALVEWIASGGIKKGPIKIAAGGTVGPFSTDVQLIISALGEVSYGMEVDANDLMPKTEITDLRAAAPWYATDQTNKVVIWSGDSTTENLHATDLIKYDGSWLNMTPFAKNIPQTVDMLNYGNNGKTLQGFVTDALPNNAGGLNTNLTYIASLAADVYVLGWMINDARQAGTGYADGNIAGASYGNAAQIAFATVMRGYLNTAVTKIRAANPKAVIIFRMPNAHLSGSTYIIGAGGLTAQNMMDAYRLVYRGDVALGFPALTDLYENVVVVDELNALFGNTMPVTSHPMINSPAATDGLHPTNAAYEVIIAKCLAPLNQEQANTISSAAVANEYKYRELISTRAGLLPRSLEDCTESGLFDEIGSGRVVYAASNGIYLAMTAPYMGELASSQAAYGATSGAYGSTSSPALALGDIGVTTNSDGTHTVIQINSAPTDINGVSIRWHSGNSPDGTGVFPVVITGAPIRYFRHKYACSEAARHMITRKSLAGYQGPTYANYYRAMVKAKGANSLTLQGIGYSDGGDFSVHVLTVNDRLCLLGVDDGVNGLLLTGAAFSNNAGGLGEKVITLTNPNLATAGWKQAIILSNT